MSLPLCGAGSTNPRAKVARQARATVAALESVQRRAAGTRAVLLVSPLSNPTVRKPSP
jgi:hypothetical protein